VNEKRKNTTKIASKEKISMSRGYAATTKKKRCLKKSRFFFYFKILKKKSAKITSVKFKKKIKAKTSIKQATSVLKKKSVCYPTKNYEFDIQFVAKKNICKEDKNSPSKLKYFNQEFKKNANDQLVPLYQKSKTM